MLGVGNGGASGDVGCVWVVACRIPDVGVCGACIVGRSVVGMGRMCVRKDH